MKKLLILITILLLSILNIQNCYAKTEVKSAPCIRSYETHMGDICVFSERQKDILYSYMGTYLYYLYQNFDTKKVKFSGRKYSNMRLYNIYHYIIHKDGSITDLTPVVLENPEFDEHVKNLIYKYPPAPLIDGMPDEMKVELEVTQSAGPYGSGMKEYIWGDYYNIHFIKGVANIE